eukprot:COSAG06_NODE_3140_length_5798_cov_9.196526_4_plen_66_part_00
MMIQIEMSLTNTNEERTLFIVEHNIQPIYRLGAYGQTHARVPTVRSYITGNIRSKMPLNSLSKWI